MIKHPQILTIAAALLLAMGAMASASEQGTLTYDKEVNTCVAEIGNHVNYEDATRVRHNVVKVKTTSIGYVFRIGTLVYSDSGDIADKEYASYCVARGNDKLVRFRINQVSA